MLRDIADLVAFTIRLSKELPEADEEVILKTPGCSDDEIRRILRLFPQMPSSYLDAARKVWLPGTTIGYFELAPSSYESGGLAEKLLTCSQVSGLRDRIRSDNSFQVGSWEADPIAVVGRTEKSKSGQVIKYKIGNPQEKTLLLSDTYEEFLLHAGNLDFVRATFADTNNSEDAILTFDRYLAAITPAKRDAWRRIAEVVLA